MNNQNEHQPQIDNQKVPLWIKIMWVLGIIWVIAYIVLGLTK